MKIKIALIGANGQLGSDIVKVFSKDKDYFVYPLTHKDIDISDFSNSKKKLDKIDFDVLVNTAAYHRVDEIEDFPLKAFEVNAVANKNLAQYANEKKSTLVFLSTDYVFGGDTKRRKPYSEKDCPSPLNVYGISKLAGEIFVKNYCQKYFIIRSCGLFGVAGSSGKGGNLVENMLELSKTQKVIRVVNDQVLSPTYTLNLAQAMAKIIKTDKYGLYHIVSEGECSRYQFTKEIFRNLKIDVRVEPISSRESNSRTNRPHYSALENKKLKSLGINIMNSWEKNLVLYLKEKGYL